MLTQTNQSAIVRNTVGYSYYFYLDNNKVKYERYSDEQALLDTNSLGEINTVSFSVDIDKNDRIHVLCLTNEGNLIYYINSNEKWSNSLIAKFDIKSNKYSNLLLRINNDNIHIMYAYSNLINSSVWTIQHIMSVKNEWQRMNVLSIATGKTSPYFNIDFDRFENIHMVYKAKSGEKENIYYTYFNFPLDKWSKFPQQISDSIIANTFPYVFADSKDNIHVAWCTSLNKEIQLAYKHLSSLGNNKFRWKQETLPSYKGSISNPLIYEEKGLIKILFNNNNVLTSIYSNDNGFTWKPDNRQSTEVMDNLEIIKYSSNYQIEKSKYKVNDLFINVENSFIQLPDKFLSKKNNFSIGKYALQNENEQQDQVIEQLPKNEPVSILEDLDKIKDELVKDFVKNTINDFEVIFGKKSEITELKTKIEKIMLDNSLRLDEKIEYYDDYYKEVATRLDNLEKSLEQCKKENDELLSIIDSAKEISLNREDTILLVSSKIDQIKEIINNESNRSILKKILCVFKKDI